MDTNKRVIEILELPAAEALAWTNANLVEIRARTSSFNWHLLAESMATQANQEPNLDWGRAAIKIYECLASLSPDFGDSFLYSAMQLRANMIIRFGSTIDDPILCIGPMLDWFHHWTQITLPDAINASKNWQTLPVAEIKALRKIKNCLTILKRLDNSGFLAAYPEIQKWIAIHDALP